MGKILFCGRYSCILWEVFCFWIFLYDGVVARRTLCAVAKSHRNTFNLLKYGTYLTKVPLRFNYHKTSSQPFRENSFPLCLGVYSAGTVRVSARGLTQLIKTLTRLSFVLPKKIA